jgi:hypothetical protein
MPAMGVLGSIDEGAVGVSYPFLETPVLWIIVAVILANTVLILLATLLSNWIKNFILKFFIHPFRHNSNHFRNIGVNFWNLKTLNPCKILVSKASREHFVYL